MGTHKEMLQGRPEGEAQGRGAETIYRAGELDRPAFQSTEYSGHLLSWGHPASMLLPSRTPLHIWEAATLSSLAPEFRWSGPHFQLRTGRQNVLWVVVMGSECTWLQGEPQDQQD